MPPSLRRVARSTEAQPVLSILLPSWNNLTCLQLCIRSLRAHTRTPCQLIVIVNEGRDGTLAWVESQTDLDYVHAPQNIGICLGLNSARPLVRGRYVVYFNDDMYALPDWDLPLTLVLADTTQPPGMLSATMIEPVETGNPCVVVRDFGRDPDSFREAELLAAAPDLRRPDWQGSTWPPNLLPLELWDLVGGLSVEFSPGMYSDPDLSMKLYTAGVRYFRGMGESLVYHFGTQSTRRVRKNRGRDTFLMKWGLTARTLTRDYLRMGMAFSGPLPEQPPDPGGRWVARAKRMLSSWKS